VFPNFWPPTSGLKAPSSVWIACFFAALSALVLPCLLLLGGFSIDLMGWEHQRVEEVWTLQEAPAGEGTMAPIDVSSQFISIGPFRWQVGTTPLVGRMPALQLALGAIALAGIGLIVLSLVHWLARRAAVSTAIETQEQMHQRLFDHSSRLSVQRGLSAQADLLKSFHEQVFPVLRGSIVQWYQVYPKHFLQLLLLITLAALIHPWLTAAALVAAWIVRNIYLWQQASVSQQRWEQQLRWNSSHEQLRLIAQTAPLMATIHDSNETLENYRANLSVFRTAGNVVLGFDRAKSPLVPVAIAILSTGLALLLALGMLDPRKHLSLGAGFVWTSSICAAIYTGYRIASALKSIRDSLPKLAQLHDYLGIEAQTQSISNQSINKKLSQGVFVEHVTLQAGSNQKLLDDVSVNFKTGQLTAIISPDPLLAKALVEMVLGFGQPQSGRLLFDQVESKDLSSQSLRDHSLWIAPNGPLLTGTIEDNLWLGLQRDATIDMKEITNLARISEAIFELPDGLQTLVSSDEQRLSPDLMFRLGIARAFLKKPSIVVAEEPISSQAGIEAETTRALLEARNHSSVVLVLPKRLSTLRAADQVVVLHHRKIADIGTHNELLERSELYRHWNYMHFAPAIR
jgi:ATP-binding cassette subfamily B protein